MIVGLINNLDYTYEAKRGCENCDSESVVHITGEDELFTEVSEVLCGKCAANLVRETDSGLADYFYDLDHETALVEMKRVEEWEMRKELERIAYEEDERERERWMHLY